jgi:cytoskeleton protein RodZ
VADADSTNDMAAGPAGEKLRRTREQAGIELAAVAAWTRIKQAHLLAVEQSDFAALPGRIYAVGFARSYAQAVGLDGEAIAREVRQELNRQEPRPARPAHHLELDDPTKIPSRRLARLAVVMVVAAVAATAIYWSSYLSPAAELPPVTAAEKEMVMAPELGPAAQISPTAESAVAVAAARQQAATAATTAAAAAPLPPPPSAPSAAAAAPAGQQGPAGASPQPAAGLSPARP